MQCKLTESELWEDKYIAIGIIFAETYLLARNNDKKIIYKKSLLCNYWLKSAVFEISILSIILQVLSFFTNQEVYILRKLIYAVSSGLIRFDD